MPRQSQSLTVNLKGAITDTVRKANRAIYLAVAARPMAMGHVSTVR